MSYNEYNSFKGNFIFFSIITNDRYSALFVIQKEYVFHNISHYCKYRHNDNHQPSPKPSIFKRKKKCFSTFQIQQITIKFLRSKLLFMKNLQKELHLRVMNNELDSYNHFMITQVIIYHFI